MSPEISRNGERREACGCRFSFCSAAEIRRAASFRRCIACSTIFTYIPRVVESGLRGISGAVGISSIAAFGGMGVFLSRGILSDSYSVGAACTIEEDAIEASTISLYPLGTLVACSN